MNFYAADQLARERQAEMARLAQADRAARLARRASRPALRSSGGPAPRRWRLAVARGLVSAGVALALPRRPALGPRRPPERDAALRRCKLEG